MMSALVDGRRGEFPPRSKKSSVAPTRATPMTFCQVRLATVLFLVARHEALRTRFAAEGECPGR